MAAAEHRTEFCNTICHDLPFRLRGPKPTKGPSGSGTNSASVRRKGFLGFDPATIIYPETNAKYDRREDMNARPVSIRSLWAALLVFAGVCVAATIATAQEPPAPGVSPRIDAIRKAGVLRVAVLSNPPWLVENTSGSGEAWAGPAWLLAQDYARLLGVKLQPVPVSHETKVPVLASNQADITISPLSVTP